MGIVSNLPESEFKNRLLGFLQSTDAALSSQEETARAAAEEEARGYDTGITYDQIARTPDEYKGKKVKFRGKVVQLVEGSTNTIRFAVNGDYSKMLYCKYDPSITGGTRVLEGDTITIYGISQGIEEYITIFFSTNSIPSVKIDRIEK